MGELLKVLAFDGLVRAVVAETTQPVERLRQIHDSSPEVTAAIGRIATGALLMAASLEKETKKEPVLTVKVAGNGPAGSFIATASPSGWVRALVENPRATAPGRPDGKLNVAGVVGTEGTFEVARDVGIGVPYSGVVPIVSGEIGEDVAHYLNESEQTPSAVALGVFVVNEGRASHAGGYMLQLMPGLDDDDRDDLEKRIEELGAVTSLLREGMSPDDIVRSLFPQGCQILGRQQAQFRCGCSMDRVERALKLLGEQEMRELLDQSRREPIELTCHFCHTQYGVRSETLVRLLQELKDESPGPKPPTAQA